MKFTKTLFAELNKEFYGDMARIFGRQWADTLAASGEPADTVWTSWQCWMMNVDPSVEWITALYRVWRTRATPPTLAEFKAAMRQEYPQAYAAAIDRTQTPKGTTMQRRWAAEYEAGESTHEKRESRPDADKTRDQEEKLQAQRGTGDRYMEGRFAEPQDTRLFAFFAQCRARYGTRWAEHLGATMRQRNDEIMNWRVLTHKVCPDPKIMDAIFSALFAMEGETLPRRVDYFVLLKAHYPMRMPEDVYSVDDMHYAAAAYSMPMDGMDPLRQPNPDVCGHPRDRPYGTATSDQDTIPMPEWFENEFLGVRWDEPHDYLRWAKFPGSRMAMREVHKTATKPAAYPAMKEILAQHIAAGRITETGVPIKVWRSQSRTDQFNGWTFGGEWIDAKDSRL